jgi:hypothetical protein
MSGRQKGVEREPPWRPAALVACPDEPRESPSVHPSLGVFYIVATMVALAVTIESLRLLGTTLGLVPVIGSNLKAAAELASAICEKAQVCTGGLATVSHAEAYYLFVQKVQEHRESYEQLAVQVGRLLMAISSVLQRTELERLGAMKANVAHFMECVA